MKTTSFRLDREVKEVLDGWAASDGLSVNSVIQSMVMQAHLIRSLDENTRWAMYSAAKQVEGFDEREVRRLIDALHI